MNHGLGLVHVVRSGDYWDDHQRKEWVKKGVAVEEVAPPETG